MTADLSPIHPRGSLVLLAGHTLVALGAALVGLLWVALFRLWCRARRTRGRPLIGGVLLALIGAAPLYAVSTELVSGDWISKQSFAPALKYGAVIAGMLGLLLLGWVYSRATTGTPANTGTPRAPRAGARFVLPVVLLGGGVLFAVADARLLPGLYPELHGLLYAFSVVCALLAACRFGDLVLAAPRARAIAGPAGLIVLAASVVLVPAFGPAALSELALGSRTAALIVPLIPMPSHVIWQELARMTVRDEARVDAPDSKEAVDRLLGGRRDYNVLLVIVDTLRADALQPARGEGQPFAQAGDTPFLDAWLSKSFRFRRAYSQASRTRRSLPPTFRSLEASEDAENVGIPLGAQATELGLLPVAVVPQYFLLPESEAAQHLLLGFDRVSFYEKDHQEVLLDRARDTFEALKGQRFLAWVHFYNMHAPYFAGPSTTGAGLTVAERYRMALKWLDGEMKRLMAALEEAGLADDTVIIFTADHGENVGLTGRVGHGGTVYEPEVRVPLAVYIPGQEGAEIDVVAGNIDIVPTIFDIVDATPKSTHRGRSLLPIFAGVERQHEPVYFENSGGSIQGVAIGGQKLVRREGGGVFHRFELLHDPTETTDLYTGETEIDRVLRRAMLRKNPALFADELVESEVLEKLLERLAEVEAGATAGADLELLLKLAALSNDPDALAQGARIFNDARDVDTALLAVRYLYATDTARWGKLLGARLAKLVGQPNELALVRGLAMQGQPAFAEKAIAARLRTLAEQPPDEWAAWLALVRSWKKAPHLYARPLEALLGAILIGPRTADETAALVSVLESVSTLGGGKGAANLTGLMLQVRPWLDDADPRVAVQAARALGTLRDAYAPKLFRAALADRALDVRVRQAILHALVTIEGKKATATIIEEGENPLLTVDALQILGRLKDRAALPFLKGIAKTHYNGYTRGEANKAIDLIKGKDKGAPATTATATATTPEKGAAPAATRP